MCSKDESQRAAARSFLEASGGPFTFVDNSLDVQRRRDEKFIKSAVALAQIWSKDPSSKVCAIAVGKQHNQVAWGYNGFPPGIADTQERLNNREMKLKLTIHAEPNALANAWFEVETLYCTHHPCDGCAPRIIAERTVKRIVYLRNEDYETRWAEGIAFAKSLFLEAKIKLTEIIL